MVGFHGCPLRCKYCLNPQSTSKDGIWKTLTTKQLYEVVKVDDLYFRSTNGGITFGGGEPVLYAEFIKEFRSLCGDKWHITLETSLNVDIKNIEILYSVVDDFIIDIKDISNDIYRTYTGQHNNRVLQNLMYLSKSENKSSFKVKIPLIPDYNSETDRLNSVRYLESLGFDLVNNIMLVNYKTDMAIVNYCVAK